MEIGNVLVRVRVLIWLLFWDVPGTAWKEPRAASSWRCRTGTVPYILQYECRTGHMGSGFWISSLLCNEVLGIMAYPPASMLLASDRLHNSN